MTQKELKSAYAEILSSEVWKGDQKMVDFCVKKVAHIVELTNGDIVVIEKPSIKKDFCFGYRTSHFDTEEFDSANAAASHAMTSTEFFLSENLSDLDKTIDILESKEWNSWDYHICIPYYTQPENSKLKSLHTYYWHDDHGQKSPRLEGEDRRRVLEGYRVVRASFEKRLHTYLKRYGTSQVNAWSYWQDA